MQAGLFVTHETESRFDITAHLAELTTHVHDELQRYRDKRGATEFRFRLGWPGLAQDEVLASIKRVGRIVASL